MGCACSQAPQPFTISSCTLRCLTPHRTKRRWAVTVATGRLVRLTRRCHIRRFPIPIQSRLPFIIDANSLVPLRLAVMRKRDRHFLKVQEYKERFIKLPTETLVMRLGSHRLIEEAAIAAREVLEERGAVKSFSSEKDSRD